MKAGKEIVVWTVNEVEQMMEVRLFLLDVIRSTEPLNLPVNFVPKRRYDGGSVRF